MKMPDSIRILLVDDDEEINKILQEALQIMGYGDVACAGNGEEAVRQYGRFLPDLVFMDIEMPVMDGLEASRRIAAMDPEARIVVLTGNPADPRVGLILEEGITETVVAKPVRLMHLRTLIESRSPGASPSLASPSLTTQEHPAFEPRL